MGQLQAEPLGKLILLVREAYATMDDLDDLALLHLGIALDNVAAPELTLKERAKRLAVWANDRWMVEQLLTTVLAERPNVQTVQAFGRDLLKNVQEAPTTFSYRPPADPHETCFVPGQLPFISRTPLRDFVRNLADRNSPGVFTVNGLTKTGKTYSFLLLESVRRALQSDAERCFSLALINLERETPSTFKPEDLARTIAMAVGWDTSALPQRASTRYAKEIAQWLNGRSLQRQGNVIVVLDGFHHDDLDRETREVVQQLVLLAASGPSNIRLVLLNFPTALIPPGTEMQVTQEQVSLLTTADVTAFFETLYRQKGRVPDPPVIDKIVQDIVQKVQSTAPNFNELLNKLVKAAAEQLK